MSVLAPSTSAGVPSSSQEHPKMSQSYTLNPVSSQPRTISRQSTVPDVTKDSSGFTWEIYGAEIDPDALKEAIHKHNQRIKEKQEAMTSASGGKEPRRRPNVQRSVTLRDNLWNPVRKMFAQKSRSQTTESAGATNSQIRRQSGVEVEEN